MPDIGAVGNEEEHRSSLAYTVVTPNTEHADQTLVGECTTQKPVGGNVWTFT
jgi:hypothetical protein